MQNIYNILIIGAGNLGLASGLMLQNKGHSVTYLDINIIRVSELKKRGYNAINSIHELTIPIDFIFVCVSTPSIKNKIFLTPLKNAVKKSLQVTNKGQSKAIIVIRSTIVPGTMEKVVFPMIKNSTHKNKIGICYFPAFMRERKGVEDELNPWIILIACNSTLTQQEMTKLLRIQKEDINSVNFTEAELIKYGSNIFNATKISYFNLIYLVAKELKIDGKICTRLIAKAAEGNWNPDYGTKAGYPFAGDCLPKDLEALIYELKRQKINTFRLLQAVQDINKIILE